MQSTIIGNAIGGADRPAPRVDLKAWMRRLKMVWESPQATDLRFGMKITMYIASR